MNSAAKQWTLAPSILGLIWGGVFFLVDYGSLTQTWWRPFILSSETPVVCALTTTFFHANLAHLLSNIMLVYMLSFGVGGLFRPGQFLALWVILAPLATLVSFLVTPGSLVGASAGLLAILGGALSLALSAESKALKKWLIFGCVFALVLSAPGDRNAHVAGFVLGYVFGEKIANAAVALPLGVLATVSAFGWRFLMS